MTDRWIAHVDMDAFYASIEIRDDPSLAGKPVVVGGSATHRGVVAAASYEARRYGIHSAMPMAKAIGLCPHLVRVAGNIAKYAGESERIMEVLHRFSPLVEPLSLDEAFLDLTGTEKLFGPPEDAAGRIKREIREATSLTASVGIAPRKFLAKIASDLRKPDGLVVVRPEDVSSFLAPLPISRLWGVGPKTLAVLQSIGIATIGDLARRPSEEICRRFGAWGEQLLALARGEDEREVTPDWEAKSYSHEETFPHDRSDLEFLESVLLDQADRVARRLRQAGVAGRIVSIKLRDGAFRTITRQHRLAHAVALAAPIYEEARRLLRENWDGRPVRLLGVGVSGIEPEGIEVDLFGDSDREARHRKLADAIDRLQDRYGRSKIRPAPAIQRDGEEKNFPY